MTRDELDELYWRIGQDMSDWLPLDVSLTFSEALRVIAETIPLPPGSHLPRSCMPGPGQRAVLEMALRKGGKNLNLHGD